MKKLIVFFTLLFMCNAHAQPVGQLKAGQVWGNPGSSQAISIPTLIGPLIDQAYSCTAQGSIIYRGGTFWTCLGPGTSGLPLVSQGVSANLHYAALANAALVNSSLTVGSTNIALGATATTLAGLTLTTPTINNGALSGTFSGTHTYSGVPTYTGLSSGTCSVGLALNSSNVLVTDACPGASASIQVGSTTVTSGTSGGVLTNTAGSLGNTTAGTLGQALVSSGGTSPPTFQSGAWVLLNTLTASNSASLSDTTHVTSSYNEYLLVFENVQPATNNITCEIQLHIGGSFQATNYQNSTIGGNSSTPFSQANTTYIGCSPNASTANSGMGISGTALLFNPSSSAVIKSVTGDFVLSSSVAGTVSTMLTGGMWNGTSPVDGFQVIMSSGNIASGTVKLYGRL